MELSPLLTGSKEGPALLLGPGSWLPRSFSRHVFRGEVDPAKGGGREEAYRGFRPCLAWLPGLLLRAMMSPIPPQRTKEGPCTTEERAESLAGERRERVARPQMINHPKQGPDCVAKSKLNPPDARHPDAGFFVWWDTRGRPSWSPVSTVGTRVSLCCWVAISS